MRQVVAALEDARRARQELVAASQLMAARRVLEEAERAARAPYGTSDLEGLREGRRAREQSFVPARGLAATGTLSARPAVPARPQVDHTRRPGRTR